MGATDSGTPNRYETAAGVADTSEWTNVVGVRLYLLVRSTQHVGSSAGKNYVLGEASPVAVADPGDGFSRHVFTTTVRLVNPAGRKEEP